MSFHLYILTLFGHGQPRIWRVGFGSCLEGVWKVSGGRLKDDWKLSVRCPLGVPLGVPFGVPFGVPLGVPLGVWNM